MAKLTSLGQLIDFCSDILQENTSCPKSLLIAKRKINHWKNNNSLNVCDPSMVKLLSKLEKSVEKATKQAYIISANELNARFLEEISATSKIKDSNSAFIMTEFICNRYKQDKKLWIEEFGEENMDIESFNSIEKVLVQLGF